MVLIGLGNPLMSDEGIGVRLVTEIQSRHIAPEDVEVLDLGTDGMAIMHAIAGRRKAVFVDCALMGEDPGTIRRFTADEVVSRKVQTRLSLHEGDLLQILGLARRVGECPGEVVIFGVEPVSVSPGQALSALLESRVDEYLQMLAGELTRDAKPARGAGARRSTLDA
jgi:hydrogenase maturation protease